MPKRVLTVSPMPPEKCAYALARYSRSPDSVADSIQWVRTHDSQKFLESFYFQYGHASIADLGHLVTCFEGISELAATEIEDEQLWDGQARSSRYQDFSKSGFIVPPEFSSEQEALYRDTGAALISGYQQIHTRIADYLSERLPRPESMKEDAYRRNIAARAFDVARYLLFLGVPTGVGQVTSIRTLERQIRRLKASPYAEVRDIADEMAQACAEQPACQWYDGSSEAIAPTLARHVDADAYAAESREALRQWGMQNLPPCQGCAADAVDLIRPNDPEADIIATLLYPVTNRPFRDLYERASQWSAAQRAEVMDVALRRRTARDELSRAFRSSTYTFDIVMDIGAYRDLHRHRRCQQFRQDYDGCLGFETPEAITQAGAGREYESLMRQAFDSACRLAAPGREYMLPFGARGRFLFKMDFAEAEYICRLRSGVKGHFSYRRIAWEMKQKMLAVEPHLGRLLEATPPWVEDPLKR
jgi:thymidylate synthase ThyX